MFDGVFDNSFLFIVWQTGSGTQSIMKMNEVLASIENKVIIGKKYGK